MDSNLVCSTKIKKLYGLIHISTLIIYLKNVSCLVFEEKMRPSQLEKRKGVSILIATLLLIAITVAASVLTMGWVMSTVSSQSNQARTQVRIDSVTWGSSGSPSIVLDIRNTGSVDAVLVSVSIRKNTGGSIALVLPVTTAIGIGTHSVVPASGTLVLSGLTPPYALSTSYVVRVTTNTGFYDEATFSSPSS